MMLLLSFIVCHKASTDQMKRPVKIEQPFLRKLKGNKGNHWLREGCGFENGTAVHCGAVVGAPNLNGIRRSNLAGPQRRQRQAMRCLLNSGLMQNFFEHRCV